ncbi:unnamed protein product, partial [Meganyctiphanes norvegica]
METSMPVPGTSLVLKNNNTYVKLSSLLSVLSKETSMPVSGTTVVLPSIRRPNHGQLSTTATFSSRPRKSLYIDSDEGKMSLRTFPQQCSQADGVIFIKTVSNTVLVSFPF